MSRMTRRHPVHPYLPIEYPSKERIKPGKEKKNPGFSTKAKGFKKGKRMYM